MTVDALAAIYQLIGSAFLLAALAMILTRRKL